MAFPSPEEFLHESHGFCPAGGECWHCSGGDCEVRGKKPSRQGDAHTTVGRVCACCSSRLFHEQLWGRKEANPLSLGKLGHPSRWLCSSGNLRKPQYFITLPANIDSSVTCLRRLVSECLQLLERNGRLMAAGAGLKCSQGEWGCSFQKCLREEPSYKTPTRLPTLTSDALIPDLEGDIRVEWELLDSKYVVGSRSIRRFCRDNLNFSSTHLK